MKLLESTSDDAKISIVNLASKARFSIQMTTEVINRLSMNELLTLQKDTIVVNHVNRMRLAVEAINLGMDWEGISRTLGFREFEDITAEAFQANNFIVYSRFVFRHAGRRFEIDVVGQRGNMVLCADCKHWSRGMSMRQLCQTVKKQVERTQMLVKNTQISKNTFGVTNESNVLFIPLIITLGTPKSKMVDSVPIVPILALRSFLAEYDLNLEILKILKTD